MNLTEKIALDCGVKASKPHVDFMYHPIPFKDYIVIDGRYKNKVGEYDLFKKVVKLISPYLLNKDIKIVQLCQTVNDRITCVDKCCVDLNKKQDNFILKNSKLVVCCDNAASYIANSINKKTITLYSSFHSLSKAPLWNKKNQISIDSERAGNLPSYDTLSESPKSINFIDPLKVAHNILNSLDIENNLNEYKMINCGKSFFSNIVEAIPDYIPDSKSFKQGSINLRLDLVKDLDARILAAWVLDRKVNIITNKDVNIQLLKYFKDNILSITIMTSDSVSEPFLLAAQRAGFPVKIYCSEKERFDYFKLKFLDWTVLFDDESDDEVFESLKKDYFFESCKMLYSKGKAYPSHASILAEKEFDNDGNRVILSKEFNKELNYFLIYSHEPTKSKKSQKK